MTCNNFYNKIITDDNLMETVQHGTTLYPFQFYNDNLELFDFHTIEWHWHDEFEFVYVEDGPVSFGIGEKSFSLPAGSGLFINSKVLHRFTTEQNGIIPNFVCLPSFIAQDNSFIFSQYVSPVANSTLDYVTFSPEVSWQSEILKLFQEIIYLCNHTSQNELLISSTLQKIWHILYQNTRALQLPKQNKQKTGSLARLQLMMQYIHMNYGRPLSLDEICSYVHISKSTALNLFHTFLHTTPVRYLIKYRLQIATKLLTDSDKSITLISMDCGFDNVDYFCKTFKKHYGVTPVQYRNSKSNAISS